MIDGAQQLTGRQRKSTDGPQSFMDAFLVSQSMMADHKREEQLEEHCCQEQERRADHHAEKQQMDIFMGILAAGIGVVANRPDLLQNVSQTVMDMGTGTAMNTNLEDGNSSEL